MTEIGIAAPNYVVSVGLVFVAAILFHLAPSGGFPGWDAGLGAGLAALILPALALALPQAAVIAKTLRGTLTDALAAPSIMAARARGLPAHLIVLKHALPNGLLPVVSLLGLQVPFLLAGSAIIESVFSLPGLGRLAFQAVGQRDLIVVEGVVMVLVTLVVISGFVADIFTAWLDPRLRTRGRP
ncbi:MAG: ABC transporter permease [Asticcacaulis sp.]